MSALIVVSARGVVCAERGGRGPRGGGSGWEWLADVLQDAGYELHRASDAHEGDRLGAREDRRRRRPHVGAPAAHRPAPGGLQAPRELRDLRDLRHRVALTRMRSSLKNRVSAILAKHGIQRPYSDLFGPASMRFLADIELRESPRRLLDSTLSLIADFTREIDATSREIDARANDDPYVPVLCQIRGVGRYIAMLIIAEVGDIDRFANARRLCSWAGPDADRPQLRWQVTPRPHLKPGLARAALGTRRGRSARRHRRRLAARQLRMHRQAPRQADRQGRHRAPDPHALLLRPARRRDPLPGTPGQGARGQTAGGQRMTRRADHAPPTRAQRLFERARLLSMASRSPARRQPDRRPPRNTA
jgi:hypothetical protein